MQHYISNANHQNFESVDPRDSLEISPHRENQMDVKHMEPNKGEPSGNRSERSGEKQMDGELAHLHHDFASQS